MLKTISTLCIFVFSFTFLSLAHSQTAKNQNTSPPVPYTSGWYLGASHLGIDADKARKEFVGDSMITLEVGYYRIIADRFTLNAGLYLPSISDKNRFTQPVKDEFSDSVRTEKSDISGWGAIMEMGYRHTMSPQTSLGLATGYRTISVDREIANCSNCYSESVSLSAGIYLRPYISIKSNSIQTEISLLSFSSGDIENGINLNFIWGLN